MIHTIKGKLFVSKYKKVWYKNNYLEQKPSSYHKIVCFVFHHVQHFVKEVFMWSPLVRRHLSDHLLWYIFQPSQHMLHIYNSCWTSLCALGATCRTLNTWYRLQFKLLQYSSTLGVPDSVYERCDILSDTCHLASGCLNSENFGWLIL